MLAILIGGLPAAAAGQSAPPPADQAAAPADKAPSEFKWSWGNTLTYGLGFRVADPDKRLIGVSAGGTAFSVNGDDGNQNYKKGLFTNAAKITSEFEFSYKQKVGGFVRGFAFYDFVNQNGDRARTPLTDDGQGPCRRPRGIPRRLPVVALQRRGACRRNPRRLAGDQLGREHLHPGRHQRRQPVDVSVLRVPGAELRDALLPVGAVKFSIKPSANTSFEAFYQYAWEETKIDPVGSYFSTADFAGAGASKVMLGFGAVPDTVAVGHAPLPPTYSPVGSAVPKRSEDLEARDDGQYGVALRLFAPALGDTEFGLYFLNYHSRLPLLSAKTGTANGLFAGNYAATADYFLVYPEDIQLLGASFNTQLARTGIALQGEVSHRWDVPLQVDDAELLYAALTPLRLLPPLPQLAPLIGLGNLLASQNQAGAYGFSQQIDGFRRFDTTQVQMTGTKAFSQILGADQVVLVAEGAWSTVHDLPDQKHAPARRARHLHQRQFGVPDRRHPAGHRARLGVSDIERLGLRAGGPLRVQQRVRCGVDDPALLLRPGRLGHLARPGRELPRGPQVAHARPGIPVPHQLGARPQLHDLHGGGPVQPDQRPRFRRGQHQVFILRQSPCAARHDSSRPSPSS